MIETAQLSRHRHRQQYQATNFGRSLESQSRAERSNIHQTRHLCPLMVDAVATLDPNRQPQAYTLTQSSRFFRAVFRHRILSEPAAVAVDLGYCWLPMSKDHPPATAGRSDFHKLVERLILLVFSYVSSLPTAAFRGTIASHF